MRLLILFGLLSCILLVQQVDGQDYNYPANPDYDYGGGTATTTTTAPSTSTDSDTGTGTGTDTDTETPLARLRRRVRALRIQNRRQKKLIRCLRRRLREAEQQSQGWFQ